MNRRIFIEKKPQFDHLSKTTTEEIRMLQPNAEVRVFIIYDIFNLSVEDFDKVDETVFADPVMDILHHDLPDLSQFSHHFAVEFLPGQFDQRADSAEQAVQLITGKDDAKIRTGILYALKNIEENKISEIKKFLINTVDAREKNLENLQFPSHSQPENVPIIDGFIDLNEKDLSEFHQNWSFAFDLDDLLFLKSI